VDEESVKNNFVLIYELIDGVSILSEEYPSTDPDAGRDMRFWIPTE